MNMSVSDDQLGLRHIAAVAVYVVLLACLVGFAWSELASIGEQRAAVAAAENMFAELNARTGTRGLDGSTPFDMSRGASAFIEADTTNVAGAALLQRVGGAIRQAGGYLLSSQVELEKSDAQDGWINLLVNCEINEQPLQALLHGIEAGMPFLYIEQLVAQAPPAGSSETRMRVLLTISGRWMRAS